MQCDASHSVRKMTWPTWPDWGSATRPLVATRTRPLRFYHGRDPMTRGNQVWCVWPAPGQVASLTWHWLRACCRTAPETCQRKKTPAGQFLNQRDEHQSKATPQSIRARPPCKQVERAAKWSGVLSYDSRQWSRSMQPNSRTLDTTASVQECALTLTFKVCPRAKVRSSWQGKQDEKR